MALLEYDICYKLLYLVDVAGIFTAGMIHQRSFIFSLGCLNGEVSGGGLAGNFRVFSLEMAYSGAKCV